MSKNLRNIIVRAYENTTRGLRKQNDISNTIPPNQETTMTQNTQEKNKPTKNNKEMSPLELVLNDPQNISMFGPIERWELAVDERTPADALRLLCLEDSKGQLSQEITENPNTPTEVVELAEIRQLDIDDIRSTAQSTFNSYILEGLAKDENNEVREMVACNSRTPADAMASLAKDEDKGVRFHVAWNSNAPASTLKELAKDKYKLVQENVAENPNTPIHILKELAKDEFWGVRWGVAQNPNTPVSTLEKLANDKNRNVCDVARKKLRLKHSS